MYTRRRWLTAAEMLKFRVANLQELPRTCIDSLLRVSYYLYDMRSK